MDIFISALLLGLMGSFHCVGMCGPIVLSIPLRGTTWLEKTFGALLYNLGRTFTYALMGAAFGIIGHGVQLAGLQQWVSIIMGALMIVSVIIPSVFHNLNSGKGIPYTAWVRRKIGVLFQQKSYGGLALIGVLNGLLPCGLVYMAIAGAIGTADFTSSVIFMVLFGLGTIPMLLAVALMGNLINSSFRSKLNRVIPYIVVLVGLIFLLRGLSLGIPYLSPPKEKLNIEFHQNKDMNPQESKPCCH